MTTVPLPGAAVLGDDEELPVNPFLALRVAYGMLLGEQDFRTLMGQPRGKQMLHNAWLHGKGVVWGYRVTIAGTQVRVSPGLALDGIGRELQLVSECCVDAADWYAGEAVKGSDAPAVQYDDNGVGCVRVRLTARFATCLSGIVPALADPCDLNRKHTDYSRVVESVQLDFDTGPQAEPVVRYPRVRMLFGLEPDIDDCVPDVEEARGRLIACSPGERAAVLLDEVRRLAAVDAGEITPAATDDDCPTFLPELEEDAGVVLAELELTLGTPGGKDTVVAVTQRPGSRATLMSTATIQDLVCGLAPGLLGRDHPHDAGGPRVIRESLMLKDNVLTFRLTRPLRRHTLRRSVLRVSSLAEAGWIEEDIRDLDYDESGSATARIVTVTVTLFKPPAQDDVRVVVRGTGPTPVTGRSGIPLAGRNDSPPGTDEEGRDAVMRIRTGSQP